jgi:hypothetical protein
MGIIRPGKRPACQSGWTLTAQDRLRHCLHGKGSARQEPCQNGKVLPLTPQAAEKLRQELALGPRDAWSNLAETEVVLDSGRPTVTAIVRNNSQGRRDVRRFAAQWGADWRVVQEVGGLIYVAFTCKGEGAREDQKRCDEELRLRVQPVTSENRLSRQARSSRASWTLACARPRSRWSRAAKARGDCASARTFPRRRLRTWGKTPPWPEKKTYFLTHPVSQGD